MPQSELPKFRELMWPLLGALKSLGGSAHITEMQEAVVAREGFTEEQQAIRRSPDHAMSLLEYRLAWARNYLKKAGAIENSSRGVWSVTDAGWELSDAEIQRRVNEWKAAYNRRYAEERRRVRTAGSEAEPTDADEEVAEEEEIDTGWKEQILSRILCLAPDGFERLAQRLLREAGLRNVEVLGRSGDGGIDGVGVLRVSVISFPVFFQCKRYRGSVGPGPVRDFRGAMAGRGEKGLLITTGTFTREARAEATRDGAPPIELVNSDDLCHLLHEYGLGVTTRTRVIDEIEVDEAFFEQF